MSLDKSLDKMDDTLKEMRKSAFERAMRPSLDLLMRNLCFLVIGSILTLFLSFIFYAELATNFPRLFLEENEDFNKLFNEQFIDNGYTENLDFTVGDFANRDNLLEIRVQCSSWHDPVIFITTGGRKNVTISSCFKSPARYIVVKRAGDHFKVFFDKSVKEKALTRELAAEFNAFLQETRYALNKEITIKRSWNETSIKAED
jgi:hypothetical protein